MKPKNNKASIQSENMSEHQLVTDRQTRWGTGGHVPTLPRPGWVVRFAQIRRVFWRSRGGGSRLRMRLKVHRISSMNTSRKCVCSLQIVYAYLASGGCAQAPTGALPLDPAGGTSVPQTRCAHPTSKPWLRH